MRSVEGTLIGLAWWAYSDSKTTRYDIFKRMLTMDPPDNVAELCRQGLNATTEPERSSVCEAILVALGETSPWIDATKVET